MLHNVYIDKNVPVVPRHASSVQPGHNNDIYTNDLFHEGNARPALAAQGEGARRKNMTDLLHMTGVQRPPFAAQNS